MTRWNPLGSRAGQRIAGAVLVAALLPLTGFGSLVFARARAQLEAQERKRLHEDVKTTAVNGLDRLLTVEAALRALLHGSDASRPTTVGLADMPALGEMPSVVVRDGSGTARHLRGAGDVPQSDSRVWRRVGSGAAALVRGAGHSTWLVVGTAEGRAAMAEISYAGVFGYGERPPLRPGNVLCLLESTEAVLSCSHDAPMWADAVAAAQLPAHGEATLLVGGADHLVRTWSLSLQRDYGAGTWIVAMMVPRAEASAPLRAMAWELALVAAGCLCVVVLTVFAAVRRQFQPLTVLGAAAARVRDQQYDITLHVRSGDEFETLANGFTSMLGAIRRHVQELEAFSVGAATALARTVDAKSPWTAGHSERVTHVALHLGRLLHLTSEEMVVLHRGGLLHDIGKLAIASCILDKPGKPTPEERAEIERHPRTGVRILEPIAAFAPLLPLVLQHHERFDGRGYPDGAAGEAIHKLARILAVADVYDAVRSDRPYRAGMAVPAVVELIRGGAGTQFDPVVVDAFLTMMADGEPASIQEAYRGVTPCAVAPALQAAV